MKSQGANFRRAVSLGLRVCPKAVPKIAKLFPGLAVCPWLASQYRRRSLYHRHSTTRCACISHSLSQKYKVTGIHLLELTWIGLIALNKADYVYLSWHGTLLTIAAATFTLLFNIFLVRRLPLIEGILVVIHIFGFFGVMVTLWVLSPTGDAKTVFVSALLVPASL